MLSFLTPLFVAFAPLCLPYIANATPRNTTRHGRGEGSPPDNSNRTVNQTLRKDWNIVIDKGFIAKIQVYPTDFLLIQNRIYSTES